MSGDWMDERERRMRERSAARARGEGGRGEDRSFDGGYPNERAYGGPDRGPDRHYGPSRAAYHQRGYGQPGFDDYHRDSLGRPTTYGAGGYDGGGRYAGDGEGDRPDRAQRFEEAGRNAGEALHRAGERVASWIKGDNAGPASVDGQRTSHRGRGPKDYRRPDERINDEAHDRLTDDHWLDASNITVTVANGEVTLSGTVEDREAKHRAELIVESISGVNHVQNNLRAAGPAETSLYAENNPVAGGTGGMGGGQSTAGRKE